MFPNEKMRPQLPVEFFQEMSLKVLQFIFFSQLQPCKPDSNLFVLDQYKSLYLFFFVLQETNQLAVLLFLDLF